MVRRVFPLVAALIASALCGACSSSGGAGPAPTSVGTQANTPSAVATSGVPADAATTAAIGKAYATFFGSSSTLAQSQAALQHGDKFTATLKAEGSSSYAQKSGAKVTSVRLLRPDVAAVTFSITSGGSVMLPDAPGYAVKSGDTWQVAAKTFCGLMKLQQQAPAACDDPAVTALPH